LRKVEIHFKRLGRVAPNAGDKISRSDILSDFWPSPPTPAKRQWGIPGLGYQKDTKTVTGALSPHADFHSTDSRASRFDVVSMTAAGFGGAPQAGPPRH